MAEESKDKEKKEVKQEEKPQEAPETKEEAHKEAKEEAKEVPQSATEEPKAEKAEEKKEPEKKPEEGKEASKERKVASKVIEEIVEKIKKLSALELSELVKELEEVFGVSAVAQPHVVASAGAVQAAGAPAAGEEKTQFDVILAAAGEKKVQVIKAVRSITGLGLKEAKTLVDEAPKPIKEGVSKEEAEKIKAELEEAGATVEVK